MKYAIQINASPFASAACDTAYRFVEAVLAAGHEVPRIFFYQEGIHNAWRKASHPDAGHDAVLRWSALAERHGIDLVVCVSAALRRGMTAGPAGELQGAATNDLADGFRLSGLGQSVEAMLECDRFMQFGRVS